MSSKKKTVAKSTKKKSKRRSDVNFEIYLGKVLKQVHPNTGITRNAQVTVDKLIVSVGSRIIERAKWLLTMNKRQTVTSREIQSAVRLVLPDSIGEMRVDLKKASISEGNNALLKYNQYRAGQTGPFKKRGIAAKVGLTFSVSRVRKLIKANLGKFRIGIGAPIYLAAVLEYLSAELLERVGAVTVEKKKVRINDRHVMLGIRNTKELNVLFGKSLIAGGVVPNINGKLPEIIEEKVL